jgi:hypothetical protein
MSAALAFIRARFLMRDVRFRKRPVEIYKIKESSAVVEVSCGKVEARPAAGFRLLQTLTIRENRSVFINHDI